MMDRYDRAIAWLRDGREHLLEDAWGTDGESPGWALFAYASDSPDTPRDTEGNFCGCLTQVRQGEPAATPELTDAIRADKRLPMRAHELRMEHIDVFAEWQRRLDAEIPNRDAGWWDFDNAEFDDDFENRK
jgi:hypothetical protein